MSFSLAQLYISAIQLVYIDGSTYDFADKKILKVLKEEAYIIGSAPVGNYKAVRFKVGLSSATNLLSPTTPSDSGILNKSEMWFSSSAQTDGYVFLNLQGKIDTTSSASGTIGQMQPFEYKIGTNANYKQVVMPDQTFSIIENQAAFAHITIDYYKLFDGIKFNQASNLSVMTIANNSTTPAKTIANNIANIFIYE